MTTLKRYLQEQEMELLQVLEEDLITFGGQAYPKFNNIVVMMGGAGSGKGFIRERLLGIEGMVFDVDRLKELSMKTKVLASKIKEETGTDINKLNLKNPDNTSLLHEILGNLYRVDKRFKEKAFTAIAQAHPDRKPNLIFDVTGKSLKHFKQAKDAANDLGYSNENIHVVWVLDDVKASIDKNMRRSRRVHEHILIETHRGASLTSKELLEMGKGITKFMNGDFWLTFNKMEVDADLVHSNPQDNPKFKGGGSYIKDAQYFRLKEQGKAPIQPDLLGKSILEKIRRYVPEIDPW